MSSSTITTKDGTEIYYKDWGKGPVVTFSHGWPLSSDAWDDQIVPVKDSAVKTARLIRGAKEIYYPGAPHGLTATLQDQVNADLLAFLRS
jgi:pimeloyl-ACP methyl ester carboxylesterase